MVWIYIIVIYYLFLRFRNSAVGSISTLFLPKLRSLGKSSELKKMTFSNSMKIRENQSVCQQPPSCKCQCRKEFKRPFYFLFLRNYPTCLHNGQRFTLLKKKRMHAQSLSIFANVIPCYLIVPIPMRMRLQLIVVLIAFCRWLVMSANSHHLLAICISSLEKLLL